MRLDGLVAVVTGAASGIGRASALAFAREGARVVAADIDVDGASATMEQIHAEAGSAVCVQVDVSSSAATDNMVRLAAERFGRLDIVFNNAGIAQEFMPIEDTPDELWDRIYAVNARGVFNGCRSAARYMKAQGGGVILNTASTAGIRPRPGLAAYNSSKGAIITLTKSLAVELAPYRIRVVAICPVATDTPMLNQFAGGVPDPETRQRFVTSIPWGRLNRPEDIASTAVFLASPEAEMITGSIIEVDGARDV